MITFYLSFIVGDWNLGCSLMIFLLVVVRVREDVLD